MRLIRSTSLAKRLAADDGFTMLFTLLALMVGTLLVAAAFTTANGDINLTQRATAQAKAYYAALAGVSRYQYQLKNSNEYWTKCPTIANSEGNPVKVPGTTDEAYIVKTLPASKHTVCESGKQATVLETGGTANGTFRILSTGTATEGTKSVTRKIVATFSHPGFTKYVYESNYEVEDPVNLGKAASTCEYYYAERVSKGLTSSCPVIQFAPNDEVNGPMHTNDAAATCTNNGSSPKFGRVGHSDAIEMNGGHYAPSGCTNEPNIVGTYTTTAGSVLPPPTDQEILEAAELKFDGRTEIELKSGSPNTMAVTNKGVTKPAVPFPSNGVLYVENSKETACAVTTYTPFGSDVENDSGCGNVYVHGTYTESLTIASADDVIINGNLETSQEASGEPTGGATLGLIAENYVRLYHPVKESTILPTKAVNSEAATSQEITAEACGTGFVKRSGTLVSENSWFSHRKEIKNLSSTTGLSTGMEVSGAYIPAGTTITLKSSTSVELSEYPSANNVTEEVWFYKPLANGYEYAPTLKKCVEPPPTGYTYHESENLFVKGSCESGTKYEGEGICKYTFTSGSCPSKATNLNAEEDPNGWGFMKDPVIDAAILSTKHSWIVDNWTCGATLGTINLWGSIAQYWRGPVGQTGSHGYIKNYNYDDRLANQQPPSFLSPTNATSWKVTRETAPPTSFTG
jgi:Tfp pilus assembly protein PilX